MTPMRVRTTYFACVSKRVRNKSSMNKPKKEKKTKTTRTCKINIINMKNQGYSSPEYFASLEKIFIHPEFSRLCRKYFLACKLQNNGPLIRQ